ncbi:TolC family protein [Kordiimonas lipolytica]|nr:TolC family protein [Kordiimonas lipolytica]
MTRLILIALALVAALTGKAGASLTLQEVLTSAREHAPKLLEQQAALRGAEGSVLAAEGAFDTTLDVEFRSRATGSWSGSYLKADAKRALTDNGVSVYGGYRVSDGRFPTYEDQYFTNSLGEFKLGVLVPLLQDRAFDTNRFRVADARLKREQEQIKTLIQAIEVQRNATIAYWEWVVAGHQLRVYEHLLAIAKQRDTALSRQVEEGAIANFALLENQQNITRRQTLVMNARQKFLMAANKLSLYYRSPKGIPQQPEEAQLPAMAEVFTGIAGVNLTTGPTEALVAKRPELESLNVALDRARQKLRLGENGLKPQLTLMGEVSRDFGGIAEGGSSRDSTDAIVGVRFSIPLGQRAARGSFRSAKADLDRLSFQRQRLMEQFIVELENLTLGVEMSQQRLMLTRQNAAQTQAMQKAEEIRFANGASDFFLLNVREEAASRAQIDHLLAALEFHASMASYSAAMMDLETLGLEEMPL